MELNLEFAWLFTSIGFESERDLLFCIWIADWTIPGIRLGNQAKVNNSQSGNFTEMRFHRFIPPTLRLMNFGSSAGASKEK
jgi:hypothetical protein